MRLTRLPNPWSVTIWQDPILLLLHARTGGHPRPFLKPQEAVYDVCMNMHERNRPPILCARFTRPDRGSLLPRQPLTSKTEAMVVGKSCYRYVWVGGHFPPPPSNSSSRLIHEPALSHYPFSTLLTAFATLMGGPLRGNAPGRPGRRC